MDESTCPDGAPTQEGVIAGYEALFASTVHLLESAHRGDLPSLVAQEADYVLRVERLSRREAGLVLDHDRQQRKAELLEGILENHLEVRRHLVRRRDELGELIGASRRQRSLRRAYGADETFRPITPESRLPKGPT